MDRLKGLGSAGVIAHAGDLTDPASIDAAMRDLAASDAGYVSLGLAPLSVHGSSAEHVPPPWMRWLLAWMRAHATMPRW